MSDPVGNIELEDVLSSIRRLVADRDPPPPLRLARTEVAAAPISAPPPAASPESDMFLLTPALRVPEPPAVLPFQAANDAAPLILNDDVAVLRPASGPSPTVDADDEASVVARLAARIEAAMTVRDEDFEPDGSEDTPVMDWSQGPSQDAPMFRSRQARLFDHDPAAAAAVLADRHEGGPMFQHRGYDTPAAPLDAGDVADPDLADEQANDLGGDLAEDLARASHDMQDDDIDPDLAAMFGRETILDEEMLRSLIVEIVRQELQGTLGERITRNVRKLVRREIFRVLSSQELE